MAFLSEKQMKQYKDLCSKFACFALAGLLREKGWSEKVAEKVEAANENFNSGTDTLSKNDIEQARQTAPYFAEITYEDHYKPNEEGNSPPYINDPNVF